MIKRGVSRTGWLALAAVGMCLALPLAAQDKKDPRIRVEDHRLIYDTTVLVKGKELDIRYEDLKVLRSILRKTEGITVLEINSTGGGFYPSMEISALIIDFELDTHVQNTCESSCVNVYLAGKTRTMARGARMGFHQLSWSAGSVEDYYTKHRERRGWDTPFKFAEWMYQDTQTETFNRLEYMVKRGVDAGFAIKTIRKPDTSMWFPYRTELLEAGVVTQ